MKKIFQPNAIEQKWYQYWESKKAFCVTKDSPNEAFAIMLPPPNVTGSLHMGHAFQDTLMDALIRMNRMKQHPTLWQMGTDHAGIATQMVVERQLLQQGQSRHGIGRNAFIKKALSWKKQSSNHIKQQLKRLGASLDWSRERFTMDEGFSKAVIKCFIDLHSEGLIYRDKRLVNWDTVLQTAISDLEIINEEKEGQLWYINYFINSSNKNICIATTRPETMFGDVAIAVNPKDKRYTKLIGKQVVIPLTNRLIHIIADSYVKPEFGTGAVKITPAHDFDDYEVGLRHNLPIVNILTPKGCLNDQVPYVYQKLERFEARKHIIRDLELQGYLHKVEKHQIKLPIGDRSHTVIEPYLTDQWFVKTASLATSAINVVKNKDIRIIPKNWEKTYFNWLENIEDWCISRQLWWGHRIPAWYDNQGNIYVGETESDIRQKNNLADNIKLHQDEDVLDTWFSSALWPFVTQGWPEKQILKFYPSSVLITGFDIIFFWVGRMIMFGLYFTKQIPFKEIYIHGLIQDQNGQKMSKSKGNVIDPIDLIDGISIERLIEKRTKGLMQPHLKEKVYKLTKKQFPEGIPAYGTDTLRFTFFQIATQGRHLKFEPSKIESSRNFCNKIWNAARYIYMNIDNVRPKFQYEQQENISPIDRWIISMWEQAKLKIETHYQNYRFDLVAYALYDFTWHIFCDWYLELTKPMLYHKNFSHWHTKTKQTMTFIMDELLHILHPIMPFITEEIWHFIHDCDKDLLMLQPYPSYNEDKCDKIVEKQVQQLIDMIAAIRNIRGEMNISPSKSICINIQGDNSQFKHLELLLQHIANIETVNWNRELEQPKPYINVVINQFEMQIALKGVVDIIAVKQRLNKKLSQLNKDYIKIKRNKLDNSEYCQKAPAHIVNKERERIIQIKAEKLKLEENLKNIDKL